MVNILGLHGNCSINGVVYSGSSIQITNGKVVIDGVPQGETLSSPKISIVVNGNAGEVHTNSGSVSVTEFPSGKAHSFRGGMKARQDAECQ